MTNLVSLLQSIFSAIIGYAFAFLVSLQLLFKFLWAPITFVKTTFYVERLIMPPCLNDPSLGQHEYISLEAVKLHYVISGEEGKPLILFVHGFPEFWYCWKYQIREFNKDYRVVAIDLRGYGNSSKPSGVSNYRLDKVAEDLKHLINALGYKTCVLVGHDFGGLVAWNFAYTYSHMLDKLVIMNAPHPYAFPEYLRSNLSQFMKSCHILAAGATNNGFLIIPSPVLPLYLIQASSCYPTQHLHLKGFAPGNMAAVARNCHFYLTGFLPARNVLIGYMSLFKVPLIPELLISVNDFEAFEKMLEDLDDNKTPDELEAYKYAFSKKGAVQCPLNYYRAYSPFSIQPKPRPLDVPTLVIWGEPDMVFNTEIAGLGRDHVTNMVVKIVKNSNHFVQSKTPVETNKLLRDFLHQ